MLLLFRSATALACVSPARQLRRDGASRCQSVACSYACATRSSVASANGRPGELERCRQPVVGKSAGHRERRQAQVVERRRATHHHRDLLPHHRRAADVRLLDRRRRDAERRQVQHVAMLEHRAHELRDERGPNGERLRVDRRRDAETRGRPHANLRRIVRRPCPQVRRRGSPWLPSTRAPDSTPSAARNRAAARARPARRAT